MNADPPPPAVNIRPVHLVPKILGLERVLADQDVGQAGGRGVRKRPLDAALDRHWAGIDLTVAGDSGIRADLDDQGILAAVTLALDLRKSQIECLDRGDLQVAGQETGIRSGHLGSSL